MQKFYYRFNLVLIIIFVLHACNQTSGVKDQNGCKYLKVFKDEAWKGKVTKKYIDTLLDDAGTLIIENDYKTLKINDAFLSDSINYQLIEVGDSIVKTKNELVVHLYKQDGAKELQTDFYCDEYFQEN